MILKSLKTLTVRDIITSNLGILKSAWRRYIFTAHYHVFSLAK